MHAADADAQLLGAVRSGLWAAPLLHGPVFDDTVSFHNFKSQNFKLSVSNPKNKYVACLSVLSRISNCQSLGRKNKLEILKTCRTLLSVYLFVCLCLYCADSLLFV